MRVGNKIGLFLTRECTTNRSYFECCLPSVKQMEISRKYLKNEKIAHVLKILYEEGMCAFKIYDFYGILPFMSFELGVELCLPEWSILFLTCPENKCLAQIMEDADKQKEDEENQKEEKRIAMQNEKINMIVLKSGIMMNDNKQEPICVSTPTQPPSAPPIPIEGEVDETTDTQDNHIVLDSPEEDNHIVPGSIKEENHVKDSNRLVLLNHL